MVICDGLQLAFMHIPKCAGTSIRRALAPFDSSRLDGYFDFPDGGRQHLHHLPLAMVKRHLPDIFSRIERYESYAVLREPRERFASALLQYLRSFRGLQLGGGELNQFQVQGRELCRRLAKAEAVREPELMHFLPQREFVVCDGAAVVRHLHCFDDLPRFTRALRQRHGVTLDLRLRANQGRTRNNPALDVFLSLSRQTMDRLLSSDGKQRLRGAWRSLSGNSPKGLYRALYEDREVTRFVDDFYAGDAALYDGARADASC